jgi:pimeloyl-ACP methyl ester carboxylesterase
MSAAFAERRIDVDGTAIRCLEAGRGATVVVLHGEAGATPTALETMLAEKFRVVALETAGFAAQAPRDAADLAARAIRTLGVERYSLMGGATAAAPAVFLGSDAAAPIDALVLVSPSGNARDLEARLGDVKATTLVLSGTREKPATAAVARMCADRLPDGYFMVVYDAGPAMETERPAALYEAVADFLERRGRFVLEREDSALTP